MRNGVGTEDPLVRASKRFVGVELEAQPLRGAESPQESVDDLALGAGLGSPEKRNPGVCRTELLDQ